MLPGHSPKLLLLMAAASLPIGCAQQSPFSMGRSSYGTLRTSLSHVEFENQQLRTKVAQLESENRDIENRLVQEEHVNGDLSARLDNARNLLSDRGVEFDHAGGATARAEPAPEESPARTLPAGRSNRRPRKAPFARIPSLIDSTPPDDDPSNRARIPSANAFGPQSSLDDNAQWLPIARGAKDVPSQVR